MIGTGVSVPGQNLPRKRPEAPLHAIANNRLADLLADGEADTHGRIAILPVARQKDKPRGSRAPSGVRGKEIRAFPQYC